MALPEQPINSVTVPIDESEFSTRAVPPAGVLARRAGTSITLIGIATDDGDLASIAAHVHDASTLVPDGVEVDEEVIANPDAVGVLLQRVADPGTVVCFASHDHGAPAAAIRASVGSRVIERATQPLFVVGPRADAGVMGDDIVVAVDGRKNPDPLLSAAAACAPQLGARVRIVNVYEPVPPDVRYPHHFTRTHGPSYDVDTYLADVARRVPLGVAHVEGVAIPDPVSVADGLADHLRSAPALALVLGSRPGTHEVWPGVVRELVRRVGVPLLVVPTAADEAAWFREAENVGIAAEAD